MKYMYQANIFIKHVAEKLSAFASIFGSKTVCSFYLPKKEESFRRVCWFLKPCMYYYSLYGLLLMRICSSYQILNIQYYRVSSKLVSSGRYDSILGEYFHTRQYVWKVFALVERGCPL